MRSIDYFDRGVDLDPDRAAIVDGATTLSFAEVQAMTKRVALAMGVAGFHRQQPAALYAPNGAGVLLALLSIWRADGQWVPVNPRNALAANIAYLAEVRCGWLFYHSSLADEVAQLRAALPALTHCICLDRALGDDPSLDAFVAGHDPADFADEGNAFGNPHDVVGLFPTGGTTGHPKPVVVTNLGWGTMLDIAGRVMGGRAADPRTLVVAPITHAAGPVSMATFQFGATQVILPRFDAGAVLAAIAAHRITHLFLPPTALYGLLDHPALGSHDLSSLRILVVAGSPIAPDRLARAVAAFGPCLAQCYGQVEAPMLVTWLDPETIAAAAAGDRPERLASCGRPTWPNRVAIMGADGRLLPPGERGEIVVKGPIVSAGYFERPDMTAEVHRDGWHHTGDIAWADAEGFCYIVDRAKDMVVTGGFNVYCAEVEAALMALPGVREAAVIGVPDAKWGEAVHAVIVAAGDLDEGAVIAHAKACLGSVKAPKAVSFVGGIPRTAAGKMDKKQLRAPWWAASGRSVN